MGRPEQLGKAMALRSAAQHVVLLGLVCALALPFFWMASTALKSPEEIYRYPATWLPEQPRIANFADAWRAAPFGRFYLNSIVTGVAATALQVGFALLMAYAFAFIRFPLKGALFALVLATLMIPDEMKLVPNYLLLRHLNWVDTYWALIIPPAAHAFPVFVLAQQFRMLPRAFIDAATVDGAGHLRTLWQVAVPVSRPVLAAVTLVSFLGRWNDFLWPLIVTNRAVMRTLPIGLAYLKEAEEGGAQWHLLMAGAVLVIMPVLALYALAQRHFVEGITQGALKA